MRRLAASPFSNLRQAVVGAVCLVLSLSVGPANAQTETAPPDLSTLRGNLVDLLANEPRLPLPVRQRRDALRVYYELEAGDILWIGTGRAGEFIVRLRDAAADGLRPEDYPSEQLERLAAAIPVADIRSRAVIELHFSAAFLEFASDLKVGRFLPNKVDPNFFLAGRQIDPFAALSGLGGAEDVGAFLNRWQPANPAYASLKALLADYRELAARGGWSTVSLGESIKPGMSNPRVPELRQRLATTDGAQPTVAAGSELVYDDDLVEVVKYFQARHGLEVDGIVGPGTIGTLNVPIEERIRGIVLAMERWRWMPEDLGRRYVMVNIAGFELRRVDAGTIEERMAVVVGKPYNRTPVFSDTIEYVEFNPYWNVPPSIAIKEELPKLRSNPASLAANGFEVVMGDRVVDVRAVDWNRYGSGNFPFLLRQRPGGNNALGRVKIMFPNRHNVYLHDTPARSLFSRTVRAFSHGCIRLARPLDLAEQVLAVGGVSGWDRGRIDRVVASSERTVVSLPQPIAVHITYLTAWVDNGTPNFRQDIYHHDEKLIAALDGKTIAW